MFSSLPNPTKTPEKVNPQQADVDADTHNHPCTPARRAEAITPFIERAPLSPCYLPGPSDGMPFVLGHVSGDVFDADPPSPGGTPSRRNITVFAPRTPPPFCPVLSDGETSPSPVRGDEGSRVPGRSSAAKGTEAAQNKTKVREEEEDSSSGEGEGSNDDRAETEAEGEESSSGEETEVEIEREDEGEDDTEAETEMFDADNAGDTEAETETADEHDEPASLAPPPAPRDDLVRIIGPLGPSTLSPATARDHHNNSSPAVAASAAGAQRAPAAWPPVTPASKPRPCGNGNNINSG